MKDIWNNLKFLREVDFSATKNLDKTLNITLRFFQDSVNNDFEKYHIPPAIVSSNYIDKSLQDDECNNFVKLNESSFFLKNNLLSIYVWKMLPHKLIL